MRFSITYGGPSIRIVPGARWLEIDMFSEFGSMACCANTLIAAGGRARYVLQALVTSHPSYSVQKPGPTSPALTYGCPVWVWTILISLLHPHWVHN